MACLSRSSTHSSGPRRAVSTTHDHPDLRRVEDALHREPPREELRQEEVARREEAGVSLIEVVPLRTVRSGYPFAACVLRDSRSRRRCTTSWPAARTEPLPSSTSSAPLTPSSSSASSPSCPCPRSRESGESTQYPPATAARSGGVKRYRRVSARPRLTAFLRAVAAHCLAADLVHPGLRQQSSGSASAAAPRPTDRPTHRDRPFAKPPVFSERTPSWVPTTCPTTWSSAWVHPAPPW